MWFTHILQGWFVDTGDTVLKYSILSLILRYHVPSWSFCPRGRGPFNKNSSLAYVIAQVINWNNIDEHLCRHISLGYNELTYSRPLMSHPHTRARVVHCKSLWEKFPWTILRLWFVAIPKKLACLRRSPNIESDSYKWSKSLQTQIMSGNQTTIISIITEGFSRHVIRRRFVLEARTLWWKRLLMSVNLTSFLVEITASLSRARAWHVVIRMKYLCSVPITHCVLLHVNLPPFPKETQIARFMGPTWGLPRSCRPQVGPMLSPWTLLSGLIHMYRMPTVCASARQVLGVW